MRHFLLLSGEALRDAGRRRIVIVVVAVSLLSIMMIESCTGCEMQVNGEPRSLEAFAGYTGAATYLVLGLWCVVLAGVLAAEHLAQTLADGSANLTLSRPVSRATFALARLAGALCIALITAAVLLGTTAALLHTRGGLAIAPAIPAALAVALGAVAVGGISMAASLALPRVACVMLAFFLVAVSSIANLVTLASPESRGAMFFIDQAGPPLLTSVALALDPWFAEVTVQAHAGSVWGRLALWALGAPAALALAFQRIELGR